MDKIGGREFKEVIRHGIENLVKDRSLLNKINVYPVPDGDTGDNLANTLKPILGLLEEVEEERVDLLAAFFATRMLTEAKGNSGVIFSQFFFSFAKAVKGQESLTTTEFGAAMEQAVKETYLSLESPREGTILTVIRVTAEEFSRVAAGEKGFASVFEKAAGKSREILEKTKEMLPHLKKAKVVDAGGLGFYLFFEGMANTFRDGKVRLYDMKDRYLRPVKKMIRTPEVRYCSQWGLKPHSPDKEKIKALIKELGQSIVISGGDDFFNVHIHTNDPSAVEALLKGQGEIVTRKVDDLFLQKENFLKEEWALVIDTGIDIPEELERERGIHLVPQQVSINERFYRDRVELSKDEFYRRMREERALVLKTSQPSPGDFKAAYEEGLKRAKRVLVFSVSGTLSGTFGNARSAVQLLEKDLQGRVSVIDTGNLSLGGGLLILYALDLLDRKVPPEGIPEAIERVRQEVLSLVYVDTLEFAIRGGRAPKIAGFLTKFLGVKPLLAIAGGTLVKAGFMGSSRRAGEKIANKSLERLDPSREYYAGIAYTTDRKEAQVVEERIRSSGIRFRKIVFLSVSPVLGVHAGPGAFGLFTLPAG